MPHTPFVHSVLVLCEISNQLVTSEFDLKRVQLFEIFEYLPSPVSYLKKLKKTSFLT